MSDTSVQAVVSPELLDRVLIRLEFTIEFRSEDDRRRFYGIDEECFVEPMQRWQQAMELAANQLEQDFEELINSQQPSEDRQ